MNSLFFKKLGWRGYAAGVICCLFLYFIVSFFLDQHFLEEQEHFFSDRQMTAVTLASRAISDRLSGVTKHFSSIAGRLASEGQDSEDVISMMKLLFMSEINNYPQVLDFAYVPYKKKEFWSSSDNKFIYDNSHLWGRTYLDQHIGKWKDYWIPPFSISPGLKMMAVVYPLRYRQLVFGVFVVVLDLDLLVGHYAYDLKGKNLKGDVFIIDGQGNVISGPGLGISGNNLFDKLYDGKVEFEKNDDIGVNFFSDKGSYVGSGKTGSTSMLFWHSVRVGNRELVVISSVGTSLRRGLLSALFRRRTLFLLLLLFTSVAVTAIFFLFHEKTWERVIASEKRYVSVVETQDELVCRFTPDWKIIFANGSCCRFFDEDPDSLVGKNILSYLSFSDRLIFNKLMKSVSDGVVSSEQNWVQCKNVEGIKKWVRWSFMPIIDTSSNISEIQAVGRDFTGIFTLQKELLHQRNAIDDILENTPVLICMITPEGDFEMVNRLGNFLLKIKDGNPVSHGAMALQSLATEVYLRGFGNYGEEIKVVDAIGRRRTLSLNLVPRKDDKGEVAGVLVAGIDVTDQRTMARELLEDREMKYLQILENVGDAVLVCSKGKDGIHRVTLSNAAARRIRGEKDENFDGVSLSHIFNVESLKKLEKALHGHREGEALSLTGRLQGVSGVFIPVEMTTMSFRQDDVPSLLIVMRDVSEQVRLAEKEKKYTSQLRSLVAKLNSVERDQRHVMANYMHDVIGQNLASIKIRLGIALRKCDGAPKEPLEQALSVVDEIISETRAMTFDMANPLLDQLGFDAAMDQLVERLKVEHDLVVSVIHDGTVDELTDSARDFIYQAVKEFLVNVVKHGKTDMAAVSVKSDDAFVRVIVRDRGVGFDTSQLADIVSKRMSFGLFSLKERIREMGGYLNCSSAVEGGTVVSVKLPLKSVLKET